MYSTCLFCNANLGSNDLVEHFPVGKRLAFDPKKGRLWVVCTHCKRWNLTPLEERFEAVEECERLFRGTMVRTSTDNIGLAVIRGGLELVRIGDPLRPEFASWRYAEHFSGRRNRSFAVQGAAVAGTGAAAVAVGAAIWPVLILSSPLYYQVLPMVVVAMTALPIAGGLAVRDYLKNDRIVGRFARAGRVLSVRTRHATAAELDLAHEGDATLNVPHDDGWLIFKGTEAIHATTVILANSNREGGDKNAVAHAVTQIEESGSVEAYLANAGRRGGLRRRRSLSVWKKYRALGAMNLSLTERLALEMAVHEETERRAMDGELLMLEAAWAQAEEIAAICDGILTPGPELNATTSPLRSTGYGAARGRESDQ